MNELIDLGDRIFAQQNHIAKALPPYMLGGEEMPNPYAKALIETLDLLNALRLQFIEMKRSKNPNSEKIYRFECNVSQEEADDLAKFLGEKKIAFFLKMRSDHDIFKAAEGIRVLPNVF
jgi:hypothetical protein